MKKLLRAPEPTRTERVLPANEWKNRPHQSSPTQMVCVHDMDVTLVIYMIYVGSAAQR